MTITLPSKVEMTPQPRQPADILPDVKTQTPLNR
jgi:hypothetical protein